MDRRIGRRPAGDEPHFAGITGSSAVGLAAPRAPIPAGGHEVLVRGDCLLLRRRTMSEELASERPHLEEAEVLPVLGVRLQPRFAPGDVEGLPAAPLEDPADRNLRRSRLQPPHLPRVDRLAQDCDPSRGSRTSSFRVRKRRPRENAVLLGVEKSAMGLEEPHGGSCLSLDDDLLLEPYFQRGLVTVRRHASCVGRMVQRRCRSGLGDDKQRAQASEYGFQNLPPGWGQGRGLPRRPLVSLVRGTVADEAPGAPTGLTLPLERLLQTSTRETTADV
jgi:hypothetical protein